MHKSLRVNEYLVKAKLKKGVASLETGMRSVDVELEGRNKHHLYYMHVYVCIYIYIYIPG